MKYSSYFLAVSFFIIILITIVFHNSNHGVYAQTGPNYISIVLSNTCLTLIKNHVNNTCPTYENLWSFDQSTPQISGSLVLKPYPHREPTKIKSECMYYLYYNKKSLVFVDPSYNLIFNCGTQQIIIEDSHFTFVGVNDTEKTNLMPLTYHQSRINYNCSIIHIDYTKVSLVDTIAYLQSDCKLTAFNDTVSSIQHDTKVDLSKTYEYIKQNWLKNPNNKENCLTKKCVLPIDPFKKPAWNK